MELQRSQLKVLGYGNCRGIDLKRFDRTPEVMEQAGRLRKEGVCTFIAVGRIVGDKGINDWWKLLSN